MAAGGNIQLWCLSVTLDNWKWHDAMSNGGPTFRTGEYREINTLSPLTFLAGKNAIFFYDQMQVEKHATPAGLGMVDKEILIIWEFPPYSEGGTTPMEGTELCEFKNFKKRVIELSRREWREETWLKRLHFPLKLVPHSLACKKVGVIAACSAVMEAQCHEEVAVWGAKWLQK